MPLINWDKVPDPPDPSVWADAPVLVPQPGTKEPLLISDGGGLPFAPASLQAAFSPLDPGEAPVRALLEQIEKGRRQALPERPFRPKAKPPTLSDEEKLRGWRALTVSDGEILYGRGAPPQLLTVAVRRGRRSKWACIGVSAARPLRAAREGIRASSWRLDPTQTPSPQDTELKLLVTEQSLATGRLAQDRLLAPDLYLDDGELVLRFYVKPIGGYQNRTQRHETPVIVKLPEPVGTRRIVDGAEYQPHSAV